jgi:hypothetical protein
LDKAERLLGVGRAKRVTRTIVHLSYDEGTAPIIAEPYTEWITYKRALTRAAERGEKTGIEALVFKVDRFREYEVRNGLPEGLLSRHKGKGTVPFEELLEKATKSNRKRPNGGK